VGVDSAGRLRDLSSLPRISNDPPPSRQGPRFDDPNEIHPCFLPVSQSSVHLRSIVAGHTLADSASLGVSGSSSEVVSSAVGVVSGSPASASCFDLVRLARLASAFAFFAISRCRLAKVFWFFRNGLSPFCKMHGTSFFGRENSEQRRAYHC
jgi:hypothetical protein